MPRVAEEQVSTLLSWVFGPLLWLWSLPQELAGLVLLPWYGFVSAERRGFVLLVTVDRLMGFPTTTGQTFGMLSYRLSRASAANWNHERRHVLQSAVLGPLFVPAYVVAGIVGWVRGRGFYLGNWFEEDAWRAAMTEVRPVKS
jgi:hypothetical protein